MFQRNQYNTPLAMSSEAELMKLSAQTNMTYEQLQSAAQAQGATYAIAEETPHIEIPKVNFYPSRHVKSHKRRRQDIKQAYKLLKPMKRSSFSPRRWWFGGKFRYSKNTAQCCIDGCNVENLLRTVGNVYDEIRDEDSGKSLWELYFTDPVTGQPQAFLAREGVTSGRTLNATYCPEHLHLYHLLCKWEAEEEQEDEGGKSTLKDKLKRGVSTVAVPISVIKKQDNTPDKLIKYEEFFRMARKDGVPIMHFNNKESGMNDLTIMVFDMRQFQQLGHNSPILHAASNTAITSTGPVAQAAVAAGLQGMLDESKQREQEFTAPDVPSQV